MHKKNKLLVVMLLLSVCALLSSSLIIEGNAFYQQLDTWTETDPNAHITVTNATHIDADLYTNEDAYVYQQKSPNFFEGNFSHRMDVYVDNVTGIDSDYSTVWALTDAVNDRKGLEDASASFLSVNIGEPKVQLGKTDVGGSPHAWAGGDDLVGCNFTTPVTAYPITAEYMTVRCSHTGGAGNAKMAIYQASDLSLLGETGEFALPAVSAWVTEPLTNSVSLVGNTEYVLAVWAAVEYNTYYDAGDADQSSRDVEAYGSFPDPMVINDTYAEEQSIYVTYFLYPVLQIEEAYGGSTYLNATYVEYDTWYYLLINRTASNFTIGIYTTEALRDAGGVANFATLMIPNLQAVVEYDYIFAVMTSDETSGNVMYVEVRNYDIQSSYEYIFYGLYNESNGTHIGAVNVTAHFQGGISPYTFEVDGSYHYDVNNKPQYFLYDLANDREYWLGANEDEATLYIFDDSTTTYTIHFQDFAGILHEYSYVEARRYVNATLRTVEKRGVDVENKIVMNLVNGVLYTIIIGDGEIYTYGDLRLTSDTTITLTLKAVDFPKATLLTYNYVRIYATRAFDNPTGNITITYEDLLELTTSVYISVDYRNGTNAYNATVSSDSFVHVWSSADNSTDYQLELTVTHERYGTYPWRQFFPQVYSEAPFGLDWFGTLPFDTAIILPAFLILFVGGSFTVLNAQLGAFATAVTAAILAYMGWIPIPAATLIVGFALALLMALIYAKRRVTVA